MSILKLEFYDVNSARQALEAMASERSASRQGNKQLASYGKAPWPKMFCLETENRTSLRFASKNAEDGVIEEAVVRLQGIICKSSLPPKRKDLRGEPGQVRYMKQSFTLNGFNSPVFCMAVDGAFNIAEFLSRKDSDMVQWAPGTMGGELTMEVSNRLFVKQDENKQHESVPIDLSVNPYGSLARLAGQHYVHTEDCVVRYFTRDENRDGTISYNTSGSGLFKPGDIVEAQCSVIVIPTRNGPHKMKLILRAMTMLSSEFSKAKWKSKASNDQTQVIVRDEVKYRRNVGYEEDAEDDVDHVNKRVKKMQVDDTV
ncbi:hypothetical protein HWV62_43543 [Athelia sp. TMB]|nr:hypothetical protein HWV62_43543 [Athelia sp. TMB]